MTLDTTRRQLLGGSIAMGATLAATSLPGSKASAQALTRDPSAIMGSNKETFVLVHGAWHSGDLLAGVANALRAAGHTVYTPTLAGNGPGDAKSANLTDAIDSLVEFYGDNEITDAIMYAHSYGGMPATGAADRLPEGAVKRLVYHVAFVPNNGESLADLNPPAFNALFEAIKQPDGSMPLPYAIWRDGLMNDATAELAQQTHALLNPHPYNTMYEKISLSKNPADFMVGKSYIISQSDFGQPFSAGGWYRFAERLGLYRHVEMPGGHQVSFTNPSLLAENIMIAGRE
jgi:pimeloyl-ACP methyl ester carboxylesterase